MNKRRKLILGVAGMLFAIGLVAAAPASAQTHQHHDDTMLHVGNVAPYPDITAASRSSRRKVRRLRRGTLRAATRFDTVAKATALGYVGDATLSPLYRPGLQHYRANGPRYRGRVLDPRMPQALVFWCPSVGDCTLAAFMYRAPAKRAPAYGGLLGWHRHHPGTSWMTHVWLTPSARSALAQCAPFNALRAYNPSLAWEPFRVDVPIIDEPCPDTAGLSG
jgi:hypothetical protein